MDTETQETPAETIERLRRKLAEYERWFRFLDGQNRVLERERQKLSAVLNHTDAGVLLFDSSLHVTWANEIFTKRFASGLSVSTISGAACHELFCGGELTCASCPVAKPLGSGEVAHGELRLVIEGEDRHIYTTAMPILSPYGDPEEMIVMLQDVSDLEILRRSQRELSESRARLGMLVEQMPAILWTTDPELRFTSSAGVGLVGLGLRPNELVGQSLYQYFGTDDPRFLPIASHLRAVAGETSSFEMEWQGRFFQAHLQPFHDGSGAVIGAVGAALDITDRKLAEESLLKRQARLRRHQAVLLELASSEWSGPKDLATALRRITEAAAKTLGVARAAIWLFTEDGSSLRCLDLYDCAADRHSGGTDAPAANFAAYFRTLEENRTLAVSDVLRDPATSAYAASYFAPNGISSSVDSAIRLAGRTAGVLSLEHVGASRIWEPEEENFAGSIADMISLALDHWERRRAEEASVRLAAAVEQAGESIVITDADWTIQYVNPAFERITGFSRREVLGRVPGLLQLETGPSEGAPPVRATLARGDPWRGRFHNSRKDGAGFEEEVTISPVRDGSGRIVNHVIVARDVTQEVALQEQLYQSQKMEAIGTLAGGVAHDFNNILTGIQGHAQLLRAWVGPGPKALRSIEVIENAARRAADLTRQLLGFARRGKFQNAPVDIHEVIGEALGLLARTLEENIVIRRDLRATNAVVLGDPGQIQQVVLNLAVNARDAMPNGGELTFSTRVEVLAESDLRPESGASPGRYLRLAVSDTGSGMDEETAARIFEPFFTTKEPGKGTGMGLAMVYGIVRNHGGLIRVASEPGRGTTFTIDLPLAAVVSTPPSDLVKDRPVAGAGRVLVVDDERLVRDLAAEYLGQLGYTVETACDGQEAVEIYERRPREIDVVLIDMVMPRMGGRDCFLALRKINPEVRAILSTGYGLNAAAQEILDEGVVGFLQKPYEMTQLSSSIAAAIAK